MVRVRVVSSTGRNSIGEILGRTRLQNRVMRSVLRMACVLILSLLTCLSGAWAKRDLVIWGMALNPDDKGQDAMIREFARLHPEYNLRVLSMGAGKMDPQKL